MIVAENEELQVQARNAHTTELERNELLRQLECTKEELFAEQKRARSRIEALEEVRVKLAIGYINFYIPKYIFVKFNIVLIEPVYRI